MDHKPPILTIRTDGQMRMFEDHWEGTELGNTELDDTGEGI
jgi:hypothetical protein